MANSDNSGLLQPGYVKIDEITISSPSSNKKLDISLTVQEFSVYEHLNKHFMTANIIVDDATSLFTLFPLTGEETVQISFSIPDPSFNKPFKYNFRIVGVQDISPTTKVRNVLYNINCVSPEAVNDWTKTISKSYANMKTSEVVEKVAKDYLGIQQNLNISHSDDKRTFVIPNISPSETIKFLAKEAKSNQYKPSNYIFYANMDGYYFKTVEEIIEKNSNIVNGVDRYFLTEKNYIKGDFMAKEKVGPGGLDPLSLDGFFEGQKAGKPFEFMKVDSYQIFKLFDLQDNLQRGAYDTTVMWIDPVQGVRGKQIYEYEKNYNEFKRVDKEGGKFVKPNGQLSKLKGDTNFKFIITNKEHNKDTPDLKADFLHYLTASVAMLDYISLEIMVPGDCTRRVGDVVELILPEYSSFDNTIGELNNHLAGKYLVVSVRHFYNPQNKTGYSLVMQLVKNNYFKTPGTPIDGNTPNSQQDITSPAPIENTQTSSSQNNTNTNITNNVTDIEPM